MILLTLLAWVKKRCPGILRYLSAPPELVSAEVCDAAQGTEIFFDFLR